MLIYSPLTSQEWKLTIFLFENVVWLHRRVNTVHFAAQIISQFCSICFEFSASLPHYIDYSFPGLLNHFSTSLLWACANIPLLRNILSTSSSLSLPTIYFSPTSPRVKMPIHPSNIISYRTFSVKPCETSLERKVLCPLCPCDPLSVYCRLCSTFPS